LRLLEKWLENLNEIRDELIDTASSIKPQEYAWEPRPGMKSAKSLLAEIAAGEIWLNHFLTNPEQKLTWDNSFKQVKSDSLEIVLEFLSTLREKTIHLYKNIPEEDLLKEYELPGHPDQKISPEEAMRYMIQHEYYHLGQLIYNRWLLGYNPYLKNEKTE
jgi:uncharacterized damage-inducible protein DinB